MLSVGLASTPVRRECKFMVDSFLLLSAAFAAGILNTIAGGGTFLTFPALVFTGVPPVIANATSAVAVFPGYLGGAAGFRGELAKIGAGRLLRLVSVTLAGGLAGSLLLMVSSNEAFSFVVPFLLLGATLTFLFGESIRSWAMAKSRTVRSDGAVLLFLVSAYGGYFNGGLGIVLLALFALWGMTDIHQMNGLKNGLSLAISVMSVTAFSLAGLVEWPQAALMMVGSTFGGYVGAPIAWAMPRLVVRGIVVAVGVSMSAIFFFRLMS